MINDDPSVIKPTLEQLKASWLTHKTRPLAYRKQQIQNLLQGVKDLTPQFHQALYKDQRASEFYSEMFSVRTSVLEIEHTLKNFEKWAKMRKIDTSMLVGPGVSYVQPEPFGVSLVISAWNYPVYTALPPLVQAIAAGNCAVLKPSEMAPHTSNVLKALFTKYLDPECFQVIEGGAQVATQITREPFDHIIFTGSPEKGKLVAKAAAENLTPCLLELGGKSPTIVDKDVNIENAALRVAQGRFLNAGQTCVACDYVLCYKDVQKQFTKALIEKTREFYGKDAQKCEDYIRIVNQDHTKRIASMLEENHGGKVEYGGKVDIQDQYIEPTIVTSPNVNSRMMQEEIFGPILPIISFTEIDEAINFINNRPKPLALYFFGYKNNDLVREHTSSGSYVQNDAVFHLANSDLPFGGVQNSGIGQYHGQFGFDACSHLRAVFHKMALNIFPYNARYPPYTDGRKAVLKTLFNYMNFTQATFAKSLAFIISLGMGYKFYKQGQFKPFIDSMTPYINKSMMKQSKL